MPWIRTRNLSVLMARAHPPASSSSSTISGKLQHFPSVVGLQMATEERCVFLLDVLSSWLEQRFRGLLIQWVNSLAVDSYWVLEQPLLPLLDQLTLSSSHTPHTVEPWQGCTTTFGGSETSWLDGQHMAPTSKHVQIWLIFPL